MFGRAVNIAKPAYVTSPQNIQSVTVEIRYRSARSVMVVETYDDLQQLDIWHCISQAASSARKQQQEVQFKVTVSYPFSYIETWPIILECCVHAARALAWILDLVLLLLWEMARISTLGRAGGIGSALWILTLRID